MKKIISSYPSNKIKIDWVTDYYDMPLKGLCTFQNKKYIFHTIYPRWSDDTDYWNNDALIILDEIKSIKLYLTQIDKWLFEKFIGYNWSYSHPNYTPPSNRSKTKYSRIAHIKRVIYYKIIHKIIPKVI